MTRLSLAVLAVALSITVLLGQATTPGPWPWVQTPTFAINPTTVYVSQMDPNATDSGPGSLTRPRVTIPSPIAAGTIVELIGPYSRDQSGANKIVASGTSTAPVIIRSADETNPTVDSATLEISGSYWTLDHVTFTAPSGYVTVLAPADHWIVRGCDISGTLSSGGFAVESYNGQNVANGVVYANRIHDNGDVHASYDQDRHGIHVGQRVSYLWILSNELARNSGDGLQINAASAAMQPFTHHIFVAGNYAHDNKQTGLWTKQATDVVFAGNVVWNHRPSNSSLGVCIGGQYAPERFWLIGNRLTACDYGIQLASDSGLGAGTHAYVWGNVGWNLHDSDGTFAPDNFWQDCGISLPGGVNLAVAQNTLHDVDSGICVPAGAQHVSLVNNIISTPRADGVHVDVENAAAIVTSAVTGHVFAPTFRYRLGSSAVQSYGGPIPAYGINSVVPSIGFLNPAAGDLRIVGVPAWANRAGSADPLGLVALFSQLYGQALNVDPSGNVRPIGGAWDAGAFEVVQ